MKRRVSKISRNFHIILLCGVIAPPLGAYAHEYIGRKPGLWEVTLSTTGPNVPSQTAQICLDADVANDLMGSMKCERDNIQRDGNRITLDSVCSVDGRKFTSKALITFTSETAYHVDLKEHAEPPLDGVSDMTITQDAKWIGPCPADVKPGDVIDPNGRKQ